MAKKPLDGVKVLDLTRVLAGPYCTMVLKNLGAEIIKVERPVTGDDSRAYGPYVNGESMYFTSINRGKKSITVDMKTEVGKKVITELIKECDVIVENYKPGTMEKLGFGYDEVKKINPEIIYAAMSGFGHTGPYSARPAYDMIVQGMGGVMSITGEPGGKPVRVGTSIGDITAGIFGAIGILAALYEKKGTKDDGQKVDVAMLDCQISILENAIAKYSATGVVPGPLGAKHPSIAPFEAYKTKDSYIILACGNDKLWAKFCKLVGKDEWIEDPRFVSNADRSSHLNELSPMMEEIFMTKTTDEWLDELIAAGLPAGPINTVDRIFKDPQVAERHMLIEAEQPNAGKVTVAGNPIKLSSVPAEEEVPSEPAPGLGEHTAEILRQYVGMDDAAIEEYVNQFNVR